MLYTVCLTIKMIPINLLYRHVCSVYVSAHSPKIKVFLFLCVCLFWLECSPEGLVVSTSVSMPSHSHLHTWQHRPFFHLPLCLLQCNLLKPFSISSWLACFLYSDFLLSCWTFFFFFFYCAFSPSCCLFCFGSILCVLGIQQLQFLDKHPVSRIIPVVLTM